MTDFSSSHIASMTITQRHQTDTLLKPHNQQLKTSKDSKLLNNAQLMPSLFTINAHCHNRTETNTHPPFSLHWANGPQHWRCTHTTALPPSSRETQQLYYAKYSKCLSVLAKV